MNLKTISTCVNKISFWCLVVFVYGQYLGIMLLFFLLSMLFLELSRGRFTFEVMRIPLLALMGIIFTKVGLIFWFGRNLQKEADDINPDPESIYQRLAYGARVIFTQFKN